MAIQKPLYGKSSKQSEAPAEKRGIFGFMKKVKKRPETPQEHFVSWIKTIVSAVLIVMVVNGVLFASFVVPTGSMENTVATGDFLFVNRLIFAPSTPQVIPFINAPLPFYTFPGIREPKQGDVIVFIFPGNRDQIEADRFEYYLKRCIATEGDTLHIVNRHVYVNGKEFALPPNGKYEEEGYYDVQYDMSSTFPPGKNYTRDNYGPIRIPKKGDVIQISASNRIEWETFIRREGHNVGYDGSNIVIDGKAASKYTVERDYVFGMGDNRNNSLDSRYWGFIPKKSIIGTPLLVYWSWDTNLGLKQFFKKLGTIQWSRLGTIIR